MQREPCRSVSLLREVEPRLEAGEEALQKGTFCLELRFAECAGASVSPPYVTEWSKMPTEPEGVTAITGA